MRCVNFTMNHNACVFCVSNMWCFHGWCVVSVAHLVVPHHSRNSSSVARRDGPEIVSSARVFASVVDAGVLSGVDERRILRDGGVEPMRASFLHELHPRLVQRAQHVSGVHDGLCHGLKRVDVGAFKGS
jgi:hypothetical protein